MTPTAVQNYVTDFSGDDTRDARRARSNVAEKWRRPSLCCLVNSCKETFFPRAQIPLTKAACFRTEWGVDTALYTAPRPNLIQFRFLTGSATCPYFTPFEGMHKGSVTLLEIRWNHKSTLSIRCARYFKWSSAKRSWEKCLKAIISSWMLFSFLNQSGSIFFAF